MLIIIATIVFEAMGFFYHLCLRWSIQEARTILTDADIKRGYKTREMDELRKDYLREKGYSIEEMWECIHGINLKTT